MNNRPDKGAAKQLGQLEGTPTVPSSEPQELREKLDAVLHLNGCQQRTAGYNEAKDGKDLDDVDMERLEKLTLDEAMALIQADREKAVREARVDELEELQGYFGESYANEARAYEECSKRIAELQGKGDGE